MKISETWLRTYVNPALSTEQLVAQITMAGLEVDAVIVVEPSLIVAEQAQGNRALYVALTRATKRLAIVHEDDLPESLLD